MNAPNTTDPSTKLWQTFRTALSGFAATKNATDWIVVGRDGHTTSFYTLAKAESWLDRVTVIGPEKAWATLRARAALAGHTATRDAAGWVTLARWDRTISFEDVGTASAWLDRILSGGAA